MLKQNEYLKTVRRPYPPFFLSLIAGGISDYSNYNDFFSQKYAIRNLVKSDEIWFYGLKEMNQGAKITFKSWEDPIIFNKARKIFKQREKGLITATQLSLKEFGAAYKKYMPALILPWVVESLVAENLSNFLKMKISDKATEQLMDKLNIPLQNNFYKQKEYDLVTTNNLKAHVKQYEWTNSRYGEENPYTLDQAKKKLKKINKKKFLEKWDKDKKSLQQVIKQTKKILGTSQAHLVDLIQFIIFYRTQRTDIMNKAGYLLIPRLKQESKKLGITYQQLLFCTFQEVISSQIPNLEIINQRIEDHAMVMKNGKVRYLLGKESNKIRKIFEENLEGTDEFKGMIAYKGLVTGTVKLVFNRDDYDKVKGGDILVTSMTSPDMVSIMKKAIAFITDEGGITCHAAIISREMKKPCIVGTKIATKVLSDGLRVEVNANQGLIKIVS